MTTPQPSVQPRFGPAAVQLFAVNERTNQLLIKHLDPAAWKAKPPGGVRSIAAIFTHMHNIRAKWIRLTAPHLGVPDQLHRARCTPQQASDGLAESAARCQEMLDQALSGTDSRIATFRRDALAAPWSAGPEILSYMLCHEAHHRGQVCMLTHQLGFPLPTRITAAMWNWDLHAKRLPVTQ